MIRSLCIATPSYTGHLHGQYVGALVETLNVLSPTGINITHRGFYQCAIVSHARNVLVRDFIEQGTEDAVLFIDADTSWRYTDVFTVLAGLEQEPIVGMAYSGRTETKRFGFVPSPEKTIRSVETILGYKTFVEASWIGTGFLGVTRTVLKRLYDNPVSSYHEGGVEYREVFPHPKTIGGSMRSEDVGFCHRASEAGYKMLVGLDSFVVHHGTSDHGAKGVREWLRERFGFDTFSPGASSPPSV